MTRFNNPLAPKFTRLKSRSSEIKGWVRELMNLPADTPVTVAELTCRDDGCPDIETVIGVLEPDKPIVTVRVHTAMTDVTKAALAKAARASVPADEM